MGSSNVVRLDAAPAPTKMEDAVSIASYVPAEAWVPAQECARELHETRERLAAILRKIEEVEEAG